MNRSPTIHILTQYLWPDDAPTGIYAEQLADSLGEAGIRVVLVGGRGRYRAGTRPAPKTPIQRLSHFTGARDRLLSTAQEYESVRRAFSSYILSAVAPADVVIVTSAPPSTVVLHRSIRKQSASAIYWLQDYYPELIRGLWDPPRVVRRAVTRFWNRELESWTRVIKAAGNLGYWGENAKVVRNWNTVEFTDAIRPVPGTALYSGNLGYGHDIFEFVTLCESLRTQGYEITVRGDGPGIRRLPEWIHTEAPILDPVALMRAYCAAEVHLVAGHPKIPHAVFPSKFWNARASGRQIAVSGFAGALAEELRIAQETDYGCHLAAWKRLVLDTLAAT